MNAVVKFDATSPADWASRIVACWRLGFESVIHTGRLIAEAKAALEHGRFEAMVETSLPFSSRTAQMLMAIAADLRLTNPKHASFLPPSWTTLYELHRLDDETFDKAIANGTIKPDVERAEIASVRKAVRKAPEDQAYRERVNAGCTLADLGELAESGAQFGAIMADPNWQYQTWSENGKDRSPDQHYSTDPLAEIAKLPVNRLAAKNSVLHLWCLDCMIPDALKLINLWGFKFIKVGFNWIKLNPSGAGRFMGLGHWTRDGGELCLFATKGHPVRRDASVRQVIEAPIGRHSEKPAEIYQRIEALTGGPYLDLFARDLRDGWTCWGDEIPRAAFRARTCPDAAMTAPPVESPPLPREPADLSDAFEIPLFLRRQSSPVASSPRLSNLTSAGRDG